MKPSLDVRFWPLDGSQWIAKTAEALMVIGVEADAIERFTRRMSGVKDFSLLCEGCVAALGAFYKVKGGPE